jgi:excisionase family DNA binding protein
MTKRKNTRADAAPAIGDRLLTLREAADVLRLSSRTVRDYVQRGEIEGRIIGGRWRFSSRSYGCPRASTSRSVP